MLDPNQQIAAASLRLLGGAGGTAGPDPGEPGQATGSTRPWRSCIRTLQLKLVREIWTIIWCGLSCYVSLQSNVKVYSVLQQVVHLPCYITTQYNRTCHVTYANVKFYHQIAYQMGLDTTQSRVQHHMQFEVHICDICKSITLKSIALSSIPSCQITLDQIMPE